MSNSTLINRLRQFAGKADMTQQKLRLAGQKDFLDGYISASDKFSQPETVSLMEANMSKDKSSRFVKYLGKLSKKLSNTLLELRLAGQKGLLDGCISLHQVKSLNLKAAALVDVCRKYSHLDKSRNFKLNNDFNSDKVQFAELSTEEALVASEPCVSKSKLSEIRVLFSWSRLYKRSGKFGEKLSNTSLKRRLAGQKDLLDGYSRESTQFSKYLGKMGRRLSIASLRRWLADAYAGLLDGLATSAHLATQISKSTNSNVLPIQLLNNSVTEASMNNSGISSLVKEGNMNNTILINSLGKLSKKLSIVSLRRWLGSLKGFLDGRDTSSPRFYEYSSRLNGKADGTQRELRLAGQRTCSMDIFLYQANHFNPKQT